MSASRQGWRGLGLPKRALKRKCSVVSGNSNLGVTLERAERMRTVKPTRVMDFQSRASKLGVKITREEAEFLQRRVLENRVRRIDGPTKVTYYRYHRYIRDRNLLELEREGILEAIEQPEGASEATKKLIPIIGIIGTISWAITGTQLAGECGMNFFGCAFVGGVSSLGGGTLNNLMFGASKGGVHWVRYPHTTVLVALTASAVTFVLWPAVCMGLAEQRLIEIREAAGRSSWTDSVVYNPMKFVLGYDLTVPGLSKNDFIAACSDPVMYDKLHKLISPQLRRRNVVPSNSTAMIQGVLVRYSPQQMFEFLDVDGSGILDKGELRRLILFELDGSGLRYTFDTIALGSSAVTGTAGAISRGLHPAVCIISSVTMCFGGILRDLICNRDISLGSQSFAGSLATGSFVYVLLRELCLHKKVHLPLFSRILLSAGATVAFRILDYIAEEPILKPMHR